MRILVWHVHGSWMTSFVSGDHEYLVPVLPDRGPDGRGRAATYPWPATVLEVTPAQLHRMDFDLVVLQRPNEAELATRWTGRRPGLDVPAVYVEHNTPRGDVTGWRHPMADQCDVPIVHVTQFNAVNWDNGTARRMVVEHGIPDPGPLWTGTEPTLAMVVNEPVRRSRVCGLDLAAAVAAQVPVAAYGIAAAGAASLIPTGLAGFAEDLPRTALHRRMARHRAYLHPHRWTSLGLSLIEAMTIGMPVLALATTAVPEAVPAAAGTVSCDLDRLIAAARQLVHDRDLAAEQGRAARAAALARFGLRRFLTDWDRIFKEAVA